MPSPPAFSRTTSALSKVPARRRTKHVIDEPSVLRRESHQADREAVGDEREVEHAAHVVAQVAGAAFLQGGVSDRLELRWVRLVGDDAERPGLRAAAIEGSLRAAQRLDALDVDQPWLRSLGGLRKRLLVEIDRR